MQLPAPVMPELDMQAITEGYGGQTKNLPGYLRISLLEACNEKCFFCHNEGYAQSRSKRISPWIVYRAVEASIELGKNKFKFTGGEPTLDPRLEEYVDFIHQTDNSAEIGIVTNGTKLAKLAAPLAAAGLSSIIVSLHSVDRDTYRTITKNDGLAAALAGIAQAKKAGIHDITINSVISEHNLDQVRDIQKYCMDEGLKLRMLDILAADEYTASIRIPPATLTALYPDIELKPKLFHEKCDQCTKRSICGEGEYLRLSASNTLDPCMYRPDLKLVLSPSETHDATLLKLALGFRRIHKDDL